jgi:hypothetical protein
MMGFVLGKLTIPVYGDNGCCGIVVVVEAEIWVQKINFENTLGVRLSEKPKSPPRDMNLAFDYRR